MRIISNEDCPQGSSEWLSLREGKVTGTKLGKCFAKSRIVGELYDTTKRNLTYYEILAERLAEGTGEDKDLSSSRERGHELESEAIDEAEKVLGIEFERGGVWVASDTHIESPDGYSKDMTTAIEVKCLSSGRHLMAYMENEPPKEYFGEYMNYFLTNDKLETLFICLYDPRFIIPKLQLKIFEIKRSTDIASIERMRDVLDELEEQLENDYKELTK